MVGGRRCKESLATGAALLMLWACLLAATWRVTLAPGWVGPWSSDAWGHVAKAEYLLRCWKQGIFFPTLHPDWYLGHELFRYYAPAPYYLLALLLAALGDPARSAQWYAVLMLGVGGSSFLLFRKHLGLASASLAGLLFLFYPDHWRVAFAEGNLPRLSVVGLLPLAVWLAHAILQAEGRSIVRHVLGLGGLIAWMVLCHAMAAAITVAMLLAFGLLFTLWSKRRARGLLFLLGSLSLGLALSAWWLLPSLRGGITELGAAAMSEAQASFSPLQTLNPLLRLRDQEAFYLGVSFLLGLLALALWKRLHPLERGTMLTGLLAGLMPLSPTRGLWSALPGSHLLWPIRFTSLAGTFLPLGLAAVLRELRGSARQAGMGVLALALAVDAWGTIPLAHPQAPPVWLEDVAARMRDLPGWRVATLDLSRMGSKPTRFLPREQVFGWAYQGTPNARAVASLNEALVSGLAAYVVDRLDEMGVDDVLWLDAPPAQENVLQGLQDAGFQLLSSSGPQMWLHRDGSGPRVFRVIYPVLGIGTGAYNIAPLWPQIGVGGARPLDDYQLEELQEFGTLFLSRAAWHDRDKAEALVRAYAEAGGTVVVDLTGSPQDVWARVPKFLGVYAEPVWLEGPQVLHSPEGEVSLAPFPPQEEGPWLAHTPQGPGLEPMWTFRYLGEEAIAVGRLRIGRGTVWFVGLNLPWHACVTGDPASRALLGRLLGLEEGERPVRQSIPAEGYAASPEGHRFLLRNLPGGWTLIPVSWRDDLRVRWNGEEVKVTPMNDLLWVHLPPGEGTLEVGSRLPPGRLAGTGISLAAGLLAGLWALRRWPLHRGMALVLAVLASVGLTDQPALAAGPIVVDGQFGDWDGQAYLDDPVGDAHIPSTDIERFSWGTNPGDSTAYFFFQRAQEHEPRGVLYLLWVDTDNNGQYGEPQDRLVTVLYRPRNGNSVVLVVVLTGAGQVVNSYEGDWGDSREEGGTRCEIGVSFADLGIGAGQAIRMFLQSAPGGQGNLISDRAPDAGDIQWSPVDALGHVLLGALLGGGVVLLTLTQQARERKAVPVPARSRGGARR
ncbi:MAG: 6-pyruvoyl-tetrahydropterin synthase-related protein [Anaerolineae bacterium]